MDSNLLMIVAMFAVVYFFMIAPQMKRAKNEKKFAAELKRGDKVITKSGMHGKIAELNEKYGKDAMKKQQETMKLYNKAGVNPMAGCVPMIFSGTLASTTSSSTLSSTCVSSTSTTLSRKGV